MRRLMLASAFVVLACLSNVGCRSTSQTTGNCDCGEAPGEGYIYQAPVHQHYPLGAAPVAPAPAAHPLPAGAPQALPY